MVPGEPPVTGPRAIWRHRLTMTSTTEQLRFPHGARVLTAQLRDGTYDEVDVWAEVDPDQPVGDIPITVVGTGYREVPAFGRYLATVQLAAGGLVFHLYVEDDLVARERPA